MPPKTERRHQQGEQSRQLILETTLAIAAERGYDGTSIGLVTERTGLPASSIYWHFGSKDELLAEALEFSYRRWRASVPEPAARQRFLVVRGETQQAIVEWWKKILPGTAVGEDDAAAVRLARFHLAVMDGLYIAMRSGRGWDTDVLVDMIASGMHAHAVRAVPAAADR